MFRLVITNPHGANLRTGPSTSGAQITPGLKLGDDEPISKLIFTVANQTFDVNSIPAFQEAIRNNTVRGDVWAQCVRPHNYRNEPTTTYVAVRVSGINFGSVIGEISIPPTPDAAYERGFREGQIEVLNALKAWADGRLVIL